MLKSAQRGVCFDFFLASNYLTCFSDVKTNVSTEGELWFKLEVKNVSVGRTILLQNLPILFSLPSQILAFAVSYRDRRLSTKL